MRLCYVDWKVKVCRHIRPAIEGGYVLHELVVAKKKLDF